MPGLLGLLQLGGKSTEGVSFQDWLRDFTGKYGGAVEPLSSRDGAFTAAHIRRIGFVAPSHTAVSEAGRILLVWDGEIYNAEFRSPDPSRLLLDAFAREGVGLFSRLNGTFALAFWEERPRRLTLAADRAASLPIYYAKNHDQFAFSGRLKPFRRLHDSRAGVELGALADMLTNGYLLQGKLLLDGVRVLGPGQVLRVEEHRIEVSNYWRYEFEPQPDPADGRRFEGELTQLIREAIECRLCDESHIGVLLSGGYDSRVIAGFLQQLRRNGYIHTITWGENEETPETDAFISRRIADHLHAKHTFYPLNASALPHHFRDFVSLDEGRTDAVGNYPESLLIFERILSELHLNVLFRGDECFGWREDVSNELEALHSLNIHDLHHLPEAYPFLRPDFRKKLVEISRARLQSLCAECPYDNLHDRKDYFYFTQRIFGYLNPLSQLKQQVIDLRNPFLDNALLDFIRRMPRRMRLGKRLFKTVVRTMFPEFEPFGIARNSNLIDWHARLGVDSDLQEYVRQILLRSENGFDEVVDRGKLERFISDSFSEAEGSAGGHPLVGVPFVTRVRRKVRRRFGYYELWPETQLFRLMLVKLWVDEFLSGDFRWN
jgi:asparagine synthetase B (glutamine-hydrolysing)